MQKVRDYVLKSDTQRSVAKPAGGFFSGPRPRPGPPNKDHLSDDQIRATNAAETPACPDCDAKMILRRSRFGLFYGCSNYPSCQGTHGAHPNGVPLGVPAGEKVKKLRHRAHELLEAKFGRKGYFRFLRKTLNVNPEKAHVAMLDERQLNVVITTLEGGWEQV